MSGFRESSYHTAISPEPLYQPYDDAGQYEDLFYKSKERKPLPPKPLKGLRFIDLFAGVGGIRLPFDELGARCVFSSEWDKYSQKTYEANYGEKPHGDITQIEASLSERVKDANY